MRPIIFRGKLKDKEQADFFNNWVYGDLINYGDGSVWIRQQETGQELEIIPETVGQFTGLSDNDGIKIFEGDYCSILDVTTKPTPIIGVVEYTDQACFEVFDQKHLHGLFLHNPIDLNNYIQGLRKFLPNTPRTINVIGNIHDNKNLING